ncbi:MAG: T9SS C-terminal target domain-containing protein [Dysgonamonadaceae bacterium]|jgi:hypothetical protein|nr:T9SS C-terminal target domain-containing protein [Dysgonamonadaceae bacterium]
MKKKTFILLMLLISISSLVPAQFVLKKELNGPRPGDEIVKQQVRYKDPGRSGENVLWDFGKLSSINDGYTLVYSVPYAVGDTVYIMGLDTIPVSSVADSELIIGTEHYTMYYYLLSDNRLRTMGHENPTNLLKYAPPLLSAVYPLAYQENHRENYASHGTYSSDQPFSTAGNIEIQADARGMMILPSNDTLKQVLRVKSVQIIRESGYLQTQTVLENYKWYVHGYRYPVFETVKTRVTTDSVETGHFETAFFYPPQDYYYLEDDEANLALPDNDTIGRPADPWEGLNYNFYPNPVTTTVNIELYLPREARVKVQLRDQTGFLRRSENKGVLSHGLHHLQLALPVLTTGNYVLTILLDDYPISEIIMKR